MTICKRCVMDSSAEGFHVTKTGCTYCDEFLIRSGNILFEAKESKNKRLSKLIKSIKISGKGKKYDCIVGVSGGVDSSWTLIQVIKLGLRPLAVHMDNGWNSELTQNNIANIVTKLNVDLYTHVIDWVEYRNLMQAFFDANVLDVELLYDNAMLAVNYQQAAKYGIKYILSGTNTSSEGMKMPPNWNWYKYDKKNINCIAKKFGNTTTKSFPFFSTVDYVWYEFFLKIRWTPFLDFLPYNKFHAIDFMKEKFSFKPYPYKHYESIFTRFYQGYILPNKFKIDKRRLHLSTLIISEQLSRKDALEEMSGIAYKTDKDLSLDIDYFLKKMRWKKTNLENYIKEEMISHDFYGSEKNTYLLLHKIRNLFKSFL